MIPYILQVQQAGTGPQQYKGPLDVAKQLYRTGGIGSLYKGACATLLRGRLSFVKGGAITQLNVIDKKQSWVTLKKFFLIFKA